MTTYTFMAPCHFGLEAVLKREITGLGYEIAKTEDGRVADAKALCLASLSLRTAERVMLVVGEYEALTWDEYFEGMKKLPWEEYIPREARFWIKKASSVNSRLFSPKDMQSLGKKAIVDRLKQSLHTQTLPETGDDYPIRVFVKKDVVTVGLDTSGDSLHKRGYRKLHGPAPISETLAAALILLTPFGAGRILADPFCGSGTFPIEAALIAGRVAPGLNRDFISEKWTHIAPEKAWRQAREELNEIREEGKRLLEDTTILGYDADGEVLRAARENAGAAGVSGYIHFQKQDVSRFSSSKKYGFMVSNPPYGERMEDRQALEPIYKSLKKIMADNPTWSYYFITSDQSIQKAIGKKPAKKRKIYNGMIRTDYYMYMGPKPAGKGIRFDE